MFGKLFLLFTLGPLLELWLLIRIGEVIGAGSTMALVILTGALGAWLAREQGIAVFSDFSKRMNHGQMPGDQLIEGLLIVIGGVLLVTPGIITDLVGFSLVIPQSRRLIRDFAKKSLAARVTVVSPGGAGHHYHHPSSGFHSAGGFPGAGQGSNPHRSSPRPDEDDIIDV